MRKIGKWLLLCALVAHGLPAVAQPEIVPWYRVAPAYVPGAWGPAVHHWYRHVWWVANYRVRTYRTALENARIRNALTLARHYRLKLGIANGHLKRLGKRIRRMEHLVERIESYSRSLDTVVEGRITPRTRSAITYFMRLAADEILELGAQPVPGLAAEQFELRSPYSTRYDRDIGILVKVPNKLEAFPGGNLLQFIDWIKHKPFDVKPGSEAHFVLLGLRAHLANAGSAWLDGILAARDAIVTGHASPWGSIRHGDFPGLPPMEEPLEPVPPIEAPND